MDTLPLYLLSGGESRRFGSDKARASVGDETLIEVAARALRPVTESVTVIADRDDKYADLGLRTLGDERPGQGPLAGIERALMDSAEPWILIATCDVLGLRSAWAEQLMEHREDGARAVVFRGSERWEPLFALYHVSILPLVQDALERGERAVWKVLEGAPVVALPLPEGWEEVGVINTPESLARYLR
ncbi:MAG: molybdenum cofactor guanylyltransferase [Bradymonadaceae bacterium]